MDEIFPALASGIISTIVCNPFDYIKVNHQLNKKVIFNYKIFIKGVNYGILAIPSFWVIYFPFYKKLKTLNLDSSISAYIACCSASTITTPLWFLRQKEHLNLEHNWNMPLKNYYKGILATYAINLSFTVQIPIYEYLKSKYENTTFNIFLISAFSKTIAACIFYPFDTVRSKIRNSENLKGMKLSCFYKGLNIYILRSIPYYTSVFCTYEFIKKRI